MRVAASGPRGSQGSASGVVNVKVVLGPVVSADGPRLVCGADRSTVHAREAGVASRFPAASVARTWNVCGPAARPVTSSGESQKPQAPVSTRHSKLPPGSLDVNAKLADPEPTRGGGPPVIVVSSLMVATAILTESGLSFLGLSDPDVISWGYQIGVGRTVLRVAWWMSAIPGVTILVTVLAINLVGEGLNDALNPKLRKR